MTRFGEVKLMKVGSVLLALGLFAFPLPTHIAVLMVVMTLVPIGAALF